MELTAFLLPTTLAIFSIAFCVVWRYGSKPAFWWMLAYAAQCLAYLIEIVPSGFKPQIDAMAVDTIFVTAFFGFGQALCHYFVLPRRVLFNACLAAAICANVAWQIFVADSLKGELLAVDLGLATLVLAPLVLDLRTLPRQPIDRAMLAVVLLTILNCAGVSSLFAIFGDPNASFETYMSTGYVEVSYTITSVLTVIVPLIQLAAVALGAIANHRSASESDSLTGLFNRRGFHRAMAQRGGTPEGVVVIGDIDHFKHVNDGFGHAVGDRVIAEFGEAARARLPAGGLAARFGGEEFVMFLPRIDAEGAEAIVRAIAAEFSERVASRIELPFGVTASFGIAGLREGVAGLKDDLDRADRALYAAKQAGRNRISVDQDRCGPPSAPIVRLDRPALRVVG